jgi:hypothetical protein
LGPNGEVPGAPAFAISISKMYGPMFRSRGGIFDLAGV